MKTVVVTLNLFESNVMFQLEFIIVQPRAIRYTECDV